MLGVDVMGVFQNVAASPSGRSVAVIDVTVVPGFCSSRRSSGGFWRDVTSVTVGLRPVW